MIRNHLAAKGMGSDTYFHWRGGEVSRLEGFSDAVFGFALTLLVVSLEVPKTFGELLDVMRGFIAFSLCFYTLYMIWTQHYLFFRRYGLQDSLTLRLNSFLLFVVLFYVYPLKFVFTAFIEELTGIGANPSRGVPRIQPREVPTLFVIYGAGFTTVFLIFALLHLHAYRKRAALELDACEQFMTRAAIWHHVALAGVGLLSIGLAVTISPRYVGLAGFAYMLIGVVEGVHGTLEGVGQRKIAEHTEGTAAVTHLKERAESEA